MAKIVSPVWSIIRGSIAGTTYSANQYAQIVGKKKIASAQLPSGNQTLLMVAFAQGANQWKALTEANRQAWAAYALTVPFSKATGTYTVSGRSLFIGTRAFLNYLNTRYAASISLLDPPPAMVGRYNLQAVTSSPLITAGDGFDININNGGSSSVSVQIDIAGPFDQTRNKWNGPWQNALSQVVTVAGSSFLLAPITGLAVGRYYFYRVRAVTTAAPLLGNAMTQVWTGRQLTAHHA